MALSKKEKLALMTAISFMHNYGENFVKLLKDGDSEENKQAWVEAKKIYKDLHARIKGSI